MLKKLVILLTVVLALSGCTQSKLESDNVLKNNIDMGQVNTSGENFTRAPLIEEGTGPKTLFNWEQVDTKITDLFEDEIDYPLGVKMTYTADEDKKEIKLTWMQKDKATDTEAMEYAVEMVKLFNDIIASQSSEVEFASTTDSGTLWEGFDLIVQIITENGTKMMEKIYKAGENIDLELSFESSHGPIAETKEINNK